MAQPKRRWSKARTHSKDQHGKKNNQNLLHAQTVTNQFYHIEFVQTVVTMMENK